MSRDNGQHDPGQPVPFFRLEDDTDQLDDVVDIESYELDYPQVSFAESLEAIQGDGLAPQDVLGFANMTLKNIHQLRAVWSGLPTETRLTLADLVLTVSTENAFTDFGRFFQVLLDDPSDDIKLIGARGAVQSEETSLIAPLVALAESAAATELREAAIRGLVQSVIALEFAGTTIDRQDTARLQRLKTWAADASWPASVRAAALETWSYYSLDVDTEDLIEDFVRSENDILQLGAMRAMIQAGAGHFTRFLEQQLQSHDVDRREAAAYAMGMSDDEAVVPMLTLLAREDTEPTVREAAYVALGNLGSKPAIRALEELRLHASDDEIDLIDASLHYAHEADELDDLTMLYLDDESTTDSDE